MKKKFTALNKQKLFWNSVSIESLDYSIIWKNLLQFPHRRTYLQISL